MEALKLPDSLPISGGGKLRVELDKRSLFALASDTRVDILKALQSNRRTVSQLADLLSIDKGAIHRHLKKLEDGGFVVRAEDHGFVYYGLSWKARDILSPNDNTRIVLLFTCTLVCLVGMIAVIYLGAVAPLDSGMTDQSNYADERDPASQYPSADNDLLSPQNEWNWVIPTSVLGLAAFALLYSALTYLRRPRQHGGEETTGPATPRPDD